MKSDIIRKIDHIAVISALIVTVFSSISGALIYEKNHSVRRKTGLKDDFHRFVKENYNREIDKTLTELGEVYDAIFGPGVRYANRGLGRTGLYQGEVFEYKYSKPPVWEVVAAGFVYGVLGFGATLFGIRLIARGIKRFSLFIEGFEDKKKEDKEAV